MMNTELLGRGLGAQRRGALVWGAAMLLLTVSVLAVWPAMNESGTLGAMTSAMPQELITALGLESLASPAGYLNGNLFALLLPLLFAALGIMHMNALTAGDEDAGRLELLLALPVGRASVYLNRFASVALVLALVSLLVGITVGSGGAALDMQLSSTGVAAVTVSMFLLALLHAALALALAGIGLRTGAVLAASFGVLVVGYLVYSLLPLVGSLAGLGKVSPWHWALGGQPLEKGFDVGGVALLVGCTVALCLIGPVAVRRRTIRTA